jgi:hypothetical protein
MKNNALIVTALLLTAGYSVEVTAAQYLSGTLGNAANATQTKLFSCRSLQTTGIRFKINHTGGKPCVKVTVGSTSRSSCVSPSTSVQLGGQRLNTYFKITKSPAAIGPSSYTITAQCVVNGIVVP